MPILLQAGDLTVGQLIELVKTTAQGLSVAAILILVIYTGAKENPWWIFGNTHRREVAKLEADLARERQEKGEWKAHALRGTDLAEAVLTSATVPR